MKIDELRSVLHRKGLAPLYMITGEDAFLRDEAVHLVRARALSERSIPATVDSRIDSAFQCEIFYGDETGADEILLTAREVSLFSSGRLIIVKWAEKLSARDGEALIPYFASPNESTTLVFTGGKLDGRLKWVQALKARAVVVDCPPPYDHQQETWIQHQAQRAGVRVDRQAIELLKESAADGLYTIWHELQKLAAYVPEGRLAGPKDVESVRGREPGTSVFELAGAIARGDRAGALRIVATNLESGEAPLRILGALLWQVQRIWKAKALVAMGKKEAEISRLLGIPAFRARDFFVQVRGWSESQLRLAGTLMWTADSALKGWGASSPRPVLDAVLLALCQETSQRRPHMQQANRQTPASGAPSKFVR